MSVLMANVRKRHIFLMEKTLQILENVLKNITQEEAMTLRDGENGWTILEVVCHLRDFDGFFRGRAEMMLMQDYPELPAYDHESLAVAMKYNEQDLREALAQLSESRERFIEFFNGLTDEQWEKAGIHPERGHFTMTDAVMQVTTHDANHLEQITRILIGRKKSS